MSEFNLPGGLRAVRWRDRLALLSGMLCSVMVVLGTLAWGGKWRGELELVYYASLSMFTFVVVRDVKCRYRKLKDSKATVPWLGLYWRLLRSPLVLLDLLSVLPAWSALGVEPSGRVALALRAMMFFSLLRCVTRGHGALDRIRQVILEKRQELKASLALVAVVMLFSSVLMYVVEHGAPSRMFTSVFSGLWWSAQTLTTVGSGNIYPETVIGKACGMIIAIAGIAALAIPTGIITSGFIGSLSKDDVKELNDLSKGGRIAIEGCRKAIEDYQSLLKDEIVGGQSEMKKSLARLDQAVMELGRSLQAMNDRFDSVERMVEESVRAAVDSKVSELARTVPTRPPAAEVEPKTRGGVFSWLNPFKKTPRGV